MVCPVLCRLDNGLPVIMDLERSVDSVVVSVWIKVGSAMESVNQGGISHFLEHMAFKGTSKRCAYDIAKEFDAIGGLFNAYTGRESTVYYAKSLEDDLSKVVDIISDVILDSQFDSHELETEKGVVLQEIAKSSDETEEAIHDKFMEVAYPNQAFGRPILGTVDRVESFDRDDLFCFVKQHYNIDNMFVIVSGKFQQEKVLELLNSKFEDLNGSAAILPQQPDPVFYKGGFYSESKKLEQLHMVLGFKGIDYSHPDYYAMDLMAAILGGGMSSRLFQEIREKRGLAYSIGSYNACYAKTGLLAIATGISPEQDKLDQFFDVCVAQMRDIMLNVQQQELNRVQSQARSSFLMRLEGMFARAEFLGVCYRYFNEVVTKEQVLQKIACVGIDGIKQCMQLILGNAQNYSFAMIGKDADLVLEQKVSMLFQ